MSSVNNKIEKVRKPRVHIKYDVETHGSQVSCELPFVVGVVGDYAGSHPAKKQKPVKERNFVNIDRDNFDSVMSNIAPGVKVRVDNMIDKDGTDISAQLSFKSLDDFEPGNIIDQIEPLKKLKSIRDDLSQLLSKADVSDDLAEMLEQLLQDQSVMDEVPDKLVAMKKGDTDE